MKEKIKGLRLNITISAVISIVIGVLLVLYPKESLLTLNRVIACIIILAGVAIILSQVFENGLNVMGIVVGAILSILGVWLLFSSEDNIFLNIIPIAIGVILVVHGVQDLGMAIEVLRGHGNNSWLLFIGAIINIALGVVSIVMAFKIIEFVTWLIGAMLIYDGLTDILFVHKVRKTSNVIIDTNIIKEEDI